MSDQGSTEWFKARRGLVTASMADKLVTPKTLKPAKFESYAMQLAGEILAGKSLETFGGNWATERGNELEPVARSQFEFEHDIDVTEHGFILAEGGEYGCSPDGLVGDDSGLEIKCALGPQHMATITHIAEHGTVPSDYRMQIEFSMLVTKRTSWHFYAYHPDLPAAHVLVKPDADVAELLASQIKACINRRDAIVQALSPTQQSEAA